MIKLFVKLIKFRGRDFWCFVEFINGLWLNNTSFCVDYDIREIRQMMRQQRKKMRHQRINPYYIPQEQQQKYHHRQLKLNALDNPGHTNNDNYKIKNNGRFHKQFNGWFRAPRKQIFFSRKRKLPTERQAEVAGLFAANSAGAGLAWFASLVGLAAMTREPLSTVFSGVNPWSQIFGRMY